MTDGDLRASGRLERGSVLARWPWLIEPLPTEAEIIAGWNDDWSPRVSIMCATFNQADLLSGALAGFLTQVTTFPFEIVVRDDASTDGTAKVLEEFVHRYPSLIRPILNTTNQRSLDLARAYDWLDAARGEFIALCEGDDFWVDRTKLERQVDFMERHPSVVLVLGGTRRIDVVADREDDLGLLEEDAVFRYSPSLYHHTSTFLARREAFLRMRAEHVHTGGARGDTAMRFLMRRYGRIGAIRGVVSVYWHDGRGVWSSLAPRDRAAREIGTYRYLLRAAHLGDRPTILRNLLNSGRKFVSALDPDGSDSTAAASRFRRRLRGVHAALLSREVNRWAA